MIRKLFGTEDNTASAILRLELGIVFFAYGAQLMLGGAEASASPERWAFSPAQCIFQRP